MLLKNLARQQLRWGAEKGKKRRRTLAKEGVKLPVQGWSAQATLQFSAKIFKMKQLCMSKTAENCSSSKHESESLMFSI